MAGRYEGVWFGLLAAACQPLGPGGEPCRYQQPAPGEVVIEPLACTEQRLTGGDGRIFSDLYVATHHFRGVIRHPEEALTIAHVGGLSLLDLGGWPEGSDRLHEAVPLVRGGWLDVDDWWIDENTIVVEGRVASLPDRPAMGEGEPATVRWVFDGASIRAEGAEGFYVHPRGFVQRDTQAFFTPDFAMRDEGLQVDLGGAVRTTSPQLWVGHPSEVWALSDDLVDVDTAADEVELLRDDQIVGRSVRAEGGSFRVQRVDAVRAVKGGRSPGPWVELVGSRVDAPLGAEGYIELVLPGERGAVVDWSSADGRSGTRAFGAGGGRLALGSGVFTLELPADPRREAWSSEVWVPPGYTVNVTVPARGRLASNDWALVRIGAPSDRNRTWRGSDAEAVRRAHGLGADAAAFLVEDGTAVIDPWASAGSELRAHGGMTRRGLGPTGPWRIDAWPISEAIRKNSYGVMGSATNDPVEAFITATGGTDELRHVRVDLPTLAALGPAHTLPQLPDLVVLDAPDPDLGSWAPWLERLDEGRIVAPTGPATWVQVPDRSQLTNADVDQALFAGEVCAGSGPRISWSRTRRGLRAHRVEGDGGMLEVWSDSGLLHQGPGSDLWLPVLPDAKWLLLVLRDRDEWAVTGPIWLVDPATNRPLPTAESSSPLQLR